MPVYVIISREGACYSTTGTPEGTVTFTSRTVARAKAREITPEMPSKCCPLRVVRADSSSVQGMTRDRAAKLGIEL